MVTLHPPGQYFVQSSMKTLQNYAGNLSHTPRISRVHEYPAVRRVPEYPLKSAETTPEYPGFPPQKTGKHSLATITRRGTPLICLNTPPLHLGLTRGIRKKWLFASNTSHPLRGRQHGAKNAVKTASSIASSGPHCDGEARTAVHAVSGPALDAAWGSSHSAGEAGRRTQKRW